MIHDELVYALIALGLHWRFGWWGVKAMIAHDRLGKWDGLDSELVLVWAVFLVGTIVGVMAFIAYRLIPVLYTWYDNGGRIFGTRKEDED